MTDVWSLPPPAETYVGPFDRERWPERLVARVVGPGPAPRIHGYDVAGDLARHHGIADVAWLALRGDLPTEEQRAALDAALVLLAPVHIGEAPAHAAFLARLAGAPPGATVAVAAVGLGELARHERTELAAWLQWLETGEGPVPDAARAAGAGEGAGEDPGENARAAQDWLDGRMRAWFGPERGLPEVPLTRAACAYAVLHRLGLGAPLVLAAVTVWARLPAVIAEAAHAGAGAFRIYPARLPDFQYVDDGGASP